MKIYLHNDVLRHNKCLVVSLLDFIHNFADYNESILQLHFIYFFFVHVSFKNMMMIIVIIIIITITPNLFILRLFLKFWEFIYVGFFSGRVLGFLPLFQEKGCFIFFLFVQVDCTIFKIQNMIKFINV